MQYFIMIVIFFLLIFGVTFAVMAPYFKIKKHGIKTTASVINVIEVRGGRGHSTYRPVFEFYDGSQVVRTEYQIGTESRFLPGAEAEIYYLPENPQKVYMENDPTPKTTLRAISVLAAVFIIAAFFFFRF